MRALDYFEKMNIDIESKIDELVKYFPVQFFKEITIQENTLLIQNNQNSNWCLLPYRSWEVSSFRNGNQEKSITFDIKTDEPDEPVSSSDITYENFWYSPYGSRFVVPRFENAYNLLAITNQCSKSFQNLKELPKLELLNLLMNLKIKDSNGVFLGLERLKKLYSDLSAENVIKPEVKLSNQPSRGYIL